MGFRSVEHAVIAASARAARDGLPVWAAKLIEEKHRRAHELQEAAEKAATSKGRRHLHRMAVGELVVAADIANGYIRLKDAA